jgi:hypothetical protein
LPLPSAVRLALPDKLFLLRARLRLALNKVIDTLAEVHAQRRSFWVNLVSDGKASLAALESGKAPRSGERQAAIGKTILRHHVL